MLVFLDTETTGLCPEKNRVIQLYAEIPQIKQSINLELSPEDGEIDPYALKVNGLTADILLNSGRMSQKEGVLALKRWLTLHLKGRRAQVVAHNAEFDCKFVQSMVERETSKTMYKDMFHFQWECTLKLFLTLRNLHIIGPLSLKLGDLAHYFGLPKPTHEASADVKTTIQLYKVWYDVMMSLPEDTWLQNA